MSFLNFGVRAVSLLLLWVVVLPACRPRTKVIQSPPHYNFAAATTQKLDLLKLKEISGITWDAKNNYFLAINDEIGTLFFLEKESKAVINEYKFGDNGDYEDVALYNGNPYILRSDGTLFKFIKDSSGNASAPELAKVELGGANDFETLYADTARKALVMICKKCQADDKGSVSAYAYYPDSTRFDKKPLFVIDAAAIEKLSPFESSKFEPSAAAINPVLQKLFILSATSRQLVIASLDGKPGGVYELGKKLFPQPEGITFKTNGEMYISNEGVGVKATLVKVSYTKDLVDTAGTKASNVTYSFATPDEKMELGKHLHEISGMAYIPATDLILAENDEKGDIFSVDFANKNDQVGKVKFGGKGDYEDIVYTDTAIYMLISSGTIVQVSTKDSSFATQEFTLPGEKNEFETMYLDKANKSLILLCKECSKEKKTGIRSAYRFDLTTNTFAAEPAYTIALADIHKMLNDEEAEFKPSAAGINPIDGKLYIVASVGKLLVIASQKGEVEKVFRLDPNMFNQPEGLTFAPNGDLYISNEGGEGIATIFKFTYKK